MNFTKLFVTAHAVDQFQKRIAPLKRAAACTVILEGIGLAVNIRQLSDGMTWRVRTRFPFPFEFRAFVVFNQERQRHAVTTIVQGGGSVSLASNHFR